MLDKLRGCSEVHRNGSPSYRYLVFPHVVGSYIHLSRPIAGYTINKICTQSRCSGARDSDSYRIFARGRCVYMCTILRGESPRTDFLKRRYPGPWYTDHIRTRRYKLTA